MAREVTVIDQIINSIDSSKNFILDAGAGSGKTYCLVQTIDYLLKKTIKKSQKILCVTFTNIAKNEISSRLKNDSSRIIVSTLHDFIWSFIKQFQIELREEVKRLGEEKLSKLRKEINEAQRKIDNPRHNTNIFNQEQIIAVNTKKIEKYNGVDYMKLDIDYDLYSAYYKGKISHDDVITIMNNFLDNDYFSSIFLDTYPYVLIDEYQDTNGTIIEKIMRKSLEKRELFTTVIGLYGDKMQMIYEDINIDLEKLNVTHIKKEDNFRTAVEIVQANNTFRSDGLVQNCKMQNPKIPYEEIKFIYNKSEDKELRNFIQDESFKTYKRLYLSNKNIANEIGFNDLSSIFNEMYNRNMNEKLLKLEDPFISYVMNNIVYLVSKIECQDYYDFIQKFSNINSELLKKLSEELAILLAGDNQSLKIYIDFFLSMGIIDYKKFESICEYYEYFEEDFVLKLLLIDINQYKNLSKQISHETTLDTMHGVKGDEFERVIVNIFENQPWNQYNFDKLFLHQDLERSNVIKAHKLLYVACTRAKSGLIINYIADQTSTLDFDCLKENIKLHFGNSIEILVLE